MADTARRRACAWRTLRDGARVHGGHCETARVCMADTVRDGARVTVRDCVFVYVPDCASVRVCMSDTVRDGARVHGGHCETARVCMADTARRRACAWRTLRDGARVHGGHCETARVCMADTARRRACAWRTLRDGARVHGGHCETARVCMADTVRDGARVTVRDCVFVYVPDCASVQNTNDFSTLSKVSAASLGYFTDDFQKYFVSRKCRRSPLIHRGYCVRSQAVSLCVKEFVEDSREHHRKQVVSLGCGFDSLYFRMRGKHGPGELCIWEVDFPAVVQRKCFLIEQTDVLRDSLGSYETSSSSGDVVLSAQDYKLIGVDLNNVSNLDSSLDSAGLRWDCPTLILAEVVLCYMDPVCSTALIGWAAQRFSTARFILYEQITPNDPFGQVMMNHFMSLNSPLQSVPAYPSLEHQRKRFLQEGWEQCTAIDMNEFYFTCIPVEQKLRIDALEPFDEFEEFHLKCSHYFILVASCGTMSDKPVLRPVSEKHAAWELSIAPIPHGSVNAHPLPDTIHGLRRFGHRSCLLASYLIITTGGFGEGDGKHQRLSDIHMLHNGVKSWDREETSTGWDRRLHHSLTVLSDGGVLVLGGRLSPLRPAAVALMMRYDSGTVTMTKKHLEADLLRWRHSAIEVSLSGQFYVFVFGGCSVSSNVAQESVFLHPTHLCCIKVSVLGIPPMARHSHSCCAWNGSTVISGGLLNSGLPSNSVTILRSGDSQFQWQELTVTPPLVPRYSHTSHVVDNKLLLVGGIWFGSHSVPGLSVIDLNTGHCTEYQINTSVLEWPLMLHGHSSILLPDEKCLLILGGGGTCFSFGTHLNTCPVLIELPNVSSYHLILA
ncbi:LOW QUALITY PROTEIN: tRNA wybutosine-synthesizing protein 4 [Pelodytes ibericus]